MIQENVVQKLFAVGNSYWLTRFVILRLLGFVYAVAFLIAAQQLGPLVGEHGLTPANHFFERDQAHFGSPLPASSQLASVFSFGMSYQRLPVFAWTGSGLSLIVHAGFHHAKK